VSVRRLARFSRFLARVVAKSRKDEVALRASALAFSTVITAVPLLAGITIFVARTLREDDGRILDLITQLLPYREELVLSALRSFLTQAESVSGIAVLGFVITSAITFFGVQESLFRIFRVHETPSIFRRLMTFSLLFFWGPLLVGSAQAGLLVVREANPEFGQLMRESVILTVLPTLITFFGLTMLYWRAAFRTISLRHAAIGGATATVLLEGLKQLFGVYVASFTAVQRAVYGTFAIALFFVLSIQLAWYILLVSAEISSCLAPRAEEKPAAPPVEPDPWIGLAALEILGAAGRPTLDAAELAPQLALEEEEVEAHLRPLAEAGWLETARGYRLAVPTRRVRIAAVLAAYRHSAALDRGGALPGNTAALRLRLRQALEFDVGEETLADLLDEPGLLAGDETLPLVPGAGEEAVAQAGEGEEPRPEAAGDLAAPDRHG